MYYYITDPYDILYLTGKEIHEVGEITLLRSEEQKYVFCDQRNDRELRGMVWKDWEIVLHNQEERIKKIWQGTNTVTVNAHTFTHDQAQTLRGYSSDLFLSYEDDPFPHQQRMIKTQTEINTLRIAQAINQRAIQSVFAQLKPWMTEQEVARLVKIAHLEPLMIHGRQHIASGTSFAVVAFGEHGANPHHTPTERTLREDDVVLIDAGCTYQGYQSDMTRCFARDTHQPARQDYLRLQNIVSKTKDFITNRLTTKTSLTSKECYEYVVRELGDQATYFTHGLGHGIGVEVHEIPFLTSKQTFDIPLQSGMVFTIEPWLYKPDDGWGVRYEDMVWIDGNEVRTV